MKIQVVVFWVNPEGEGSKVPQSICILSITSCITTEKTTACTQYYQYV